MTYGPFSHILAKEAEPFPKLFRDMTLKTAFWTTNTIRNILNKKLISLDPFSDSNTYHLSYQKFPKKYRNQTGRNIKIRYNEHIQDTRTIKPPQSMHNIYWKRAIHMALLHTLESSILQRMDPT